MLLWRKGGALEVKETGNTLGKRTKQRTGEEKMVIDVAIKFSKNVDGSEARSLKRIPPARSAGNVTIRIEVTVTCNYINSKTLCQCQSTLKFVQSRYKGGRLIRTTLLKIIQLPFLFFSSHSF